MLEKMEKHVEAMVLNHEYYMYCQDCEENQMVMIVEHLSKMRDLRLLIMKCVNISGNISCLCLSNELRYVEWDSYPFKYLPLSFQPNQLVELILKSSSIETLWKGKKYLPNLRNLDLSYSQNLIKMPHFGEFPNLERLDLEGCIKLVQLDPSIRLLTKLVYLNLNDCKSIISLLSNIFGLSCLDDLNMFYNPRHLNISASHSQSRTSSIFRWITLPYQYLFPTPTTHTNLFPSLHSLRELDISFCGLCQIPDSIGCLYWLVGLNVGGNNFVTVPSLRELSKLVYLNLEHCRLLESLPQLPFPIIIGLDHEKNKNCRTTGLFIFNCPNLGEMERCSSMTFSWIMKFIQENPHSYPTYFDRIQVVTPGSEIPSWIKNQSAGGSKPTYIYPTFYQRNNISGLLYWVVFSMTPHDPTMITSYPSRANMTLRFSAIKGSGPAMINSILPVILDRDLVTVKSNHIWIIYYPQSSYDILYGFMDVEIIRGEGLGLKVKNCGYHWVYKEDLEVFDLAMMYHENSLSRKRKILAIDYETQPQPQPQPKSFIHHIE